MAPSASPYSVFKAEDWMVPPAPIGIGQCVRVRPRKRYRSNGSTKKKSGTTLNTASSRSHVQLAFA